MSLMQNDCLYLSTTTLADLRAAWVGILWGSRAWMFLPVGSTLGFLMGSPPGPGSTYPPFSACHIAQHELVSFKLRREQSMCFTLNWLM